MPCITIALLDIRVTPNVALVRVNPLRLPVGLLAALLDRIARPLRQRAENRTDMAVSSLAASANHAQQVFGRRIGRLEAYAYCGDVPARNTRARARLPFPGPGSSAARRPARRQRRNRLQCGPTNAQIAFKPLPPGRARDGKSNNQTCENGGHMQLVRHQLGEWGKQHAVFGHRHLSKIVGDYLDSEMLNLFDVMEALSVDSEPWAQARELRGCLHAVSSALDWVTLRDDAGRPRCRALSHHCCGSQGLELGCQQRAVRVWSPCPMSQFDLDLRLFEDREDGGDSSEWTTIGVPTCPTDSDKCCLPEPSWQVRIGRY